jgi:hypothetical protein
MYIQHTHTHQSKDRYGNNRTSAEDFDVMRNETLSANHPMLFMRVARANGITEARVMFQKVGEYTVHVKLSNINLAQSPLSVTVIPGAAYAPNCFNLTAVPHRSIAGNELSFTIQAVDAFGNKLVQSGADFDVTLRGFDFLRTYIGGQPCEAVSTVEKCVKITYNTSGQYQVKFRPTVAGDYLLTALLLHDDGTPPDEIGPAGTPLASPWRQCPTCGTLSVTPAEPTIDASKTAGTGASQFVAGEDATFTLFSRDIYSNDLTIGGAAISAFMVGGVPLSRVNVSVVDECLDSLSAPELCGQYTLSYMHTVAGTYTMTVLLNGEMGKPFQIIGFPANVSDPAGTGLPLLPNSPPGCTEVCSDEKCCLAGQAASFGIVGVQNEFIIVARDRFGNEMTKGGDSISVDVVGKTIGEGSVRDLGTGQYLVRYRTLVKDTYTLSIRMRGIHIGMLYDDCPGPDNQCFMGSPFQNLLVSPPGTGLEGLIIYGDLYNEQVVRLDRTNADEKGFLVIMSIYMPASIMYVKLNFMETHVNLPSRTPQYCRFSRSYHTPKTRATSTGSVSNSNTRTLLPCRWAMYTT